MRNKIFLSINGCEQGFLTEGCNIPFSLRNKFKGFIKDRILVTGLNHVIFPDSLTGSKTLIFYKTVDESTPRLGLALSKSEKLTLQFEFYHPYEYGNLKRIYSFTLHDSVLTEISNIYPNILSAKNLIPREIIKLNYRRISWIED